MKNVNLNRQVVNIKIGCEKGKKKQHRGPKHGCLKVKHHPEHRHRVSQRWCENICLDFRVAHNDCPQTLWRAVDLEPMGTLKLENRSFEPIELIVTKHHGHEIIEAVQAKSTISLTLKELEKVEVACDNLEQKTPCYGQLRLHLVIPCGRNNFESCRIG